MAKHHAEPTAEEIIDRMNDEFYGAMKAIDGLEQTLREELKKFEKLCAAGGFIEEVNTSGGRAEDERAGDSRKLTQEDSAAVLAAENQQA